MNKDLSMFLSPSKVLQEIFMDGTIRNPSEKLIKGNNEVRDDPKLIEEPVTSNSEAIENSKILEDYAEKTFETTEESDLSENNPYVQYDQFESNESQECLFNEYIFPECEILSSITYDRNREINTDLWLDHLFEKHQDGLKKFVQIFVLNAKFMGIYFETEETFHIAHHINNLMEKVALKVADAIPIFSCKTSVSGSWAESTKVTQPSLITTGLYRNSRDISYLKNQMKIQRGMLN